MYHFGLCSLSQEGRDFGDEYLAELDHIGEHACILVQIEFRFENVVYSTICFKFHSLRGTTLEFLHHHVHRS